MSPSFCRRAFLNRSLAGAAILGAPLAGGLAACAQRPSAGVQTPDPALSPADLAWLNRLSFGATTRSAAHLASVGRAAYLDEQLSSGAARALPDAIQAQIDALSIAQRSMDMRVREGEQQRRAADALAVDEDKKAV